MQTKLAISMLVTALLLRADPPSNPNPGGTTAADGAQTKIANFTFEPIGMGDLLSVYVANSTDLTRTYRVGVDGTITLPVLKSPLYVAGMMATDVDKVIASAVAREKILVNPVVSVSVVEYRSRPVNVVGAVRQPTTFQALGYVRLLDAISRADGLTADAGQEIVVSRPVLSIATGSISSQVQHIPIKELMDGSDPSLNVVLKGGEEIQVPAAGKLYIVGNVKSPGVYPVTEPDGLTVLKALALCQGTLPFTMATAVVYRPNRGVPGRQEFEVPLKAILKRRVADFYLEPNDILYVMDNSSRRLSSEVLDRITGFSSTTVTGLIVWRRP